MQPVVYFDVKTRLAVSLIIQVISKKCRKLKHFTEITWEMLSVQKSTNADKSNLLHIAVTLETLP